MQKLPLTILTATLLAIVSLGADAPKADKILKPDAEGFIRNWIVLDPILLKDVGEHDEAVEKPMIAKEYFKDQLTGHQKVGDKVKVDGRDLVWHAVEINDYAIDFVKFCEDHQQSPDSALFWGVAYVIAPAEIKDVKLSVGSDDSSVWFVNGKEVISHYESRAVAQDDDASKPLTLNKGLNVIRFAVINGDGPSGACARFLDAAGKPVKDYTVTLTAPAE